MTSFILNSIYKLSKSLVLQNTIKQSANNFPKYLSNTRDKDKDKDRDNKSQLSLDDEERFNLVSSTAVDGEKVAEEKEEARKKYVEENLKPLNAGFYHGIQYPTATTQNLLLVNDVLYKDLPIIHIKSTKNNTMFSLSDSRGKILYSNSAGTIGFKNAKRGTTTAAQAAAVALSDHTKRRGLCDLRVVTQGIGNGRLASIKAIQTSGLNIISITDKTVIPLPYLKPLRPCKKRRV